MGSIFSSQRQNNSSSSTDQRTQSNGRNTSSNDNIYPAEVVGVVDESTEGGGLVEEELCAAASVGHRGSFSSTLNKKSTNITVDKKVSRRTKRYVSVCNAMILIYIAMSFYILRHCQLQNIIELKYVSQRSFF